MTNQENEEVIRCRTCYIALTGGSPTPLHCPLSKPSKHVSALIWSSLNSQHSNLQALTGAHIHRAVQQIRAEDVLDARGHGLAAVV